MILKLIRKEILIRKKFLLSVVFYGLIAILASILGGPRLIEVVYIFSIIVFTYFFITTGAEIEGKKNTGVIFSSLPLRKREIVTAKYITAALFPLYSLLIMTVLGFAFTTLWAGIKFIGLNDSLIALLSTWFFLGLALPIIFIFSSTTARVINYIILFTIMFGPFERYIRATQPLDWEPILWFLAVFVFLLLSWLFSVWVYQKQDL